MSHRNRLRSLLSNHSTNIISHRPRTRLAVETLEDRAVPAGLSVADTVVIEGDETVRSLGAVVSLGSGGLSRPHSLILGPDGNLYVSAHTESGAVYRYDAATGSPLPAPGKSGAAFVSPGSGGLNLARDMAFGPDGDLYALSEGTDSVLRYDPTTGEFKGVFVASGAGGLDAPRDLLFQNGYLYVASCGPLGGVGAGVDSVLRYDATTGAPAGLSGQPGDAVFIASGSGGLNNPSRIVFGPDGKVYVSSTAPSSESPTSNSVLRYDSATGAPAGVSGQPGDAFFVSQGSGGLDGPTSMVFRPDGYIYVTSWRNDSVLRYHSSTGAFAGTVVPAGSGGLDAPLDLLFEPNGNFLVTSWLTDQVLRYGAASQAAFTVSLSSASATPVTVSYATANGTATAGSDYTAVTGTLTFAPGQTTQTVLVSTLDDALAESTETITLILSDPVGATITDGSGVAAITDDDASRQVTITDASAVEGDNHPHYRGPFIDGVPGGHFNPLTFGPDGYVYTAVGTGAGYNSIRRYDAATGAFIDTFVPPGRIDGVRDIVFRGGFMYVASAYTDEVLRYNATTGAFVDAFVTANSGGIDHPDGMLFGPDANGDGTPELYVTGWLSHSVVRYDGATGQPLGTFITAGSGGLSYPFSLAFGPGGVFVTSAGTNQILKYSATTGAYLGVAASTGLDYPRGLTFGPDGLLYVTSGDNDRILRFTSSGTYVDDYVPAGAGGMDNPRTPRFGPDGDLYVTSTGNAEILRFGTQNEALFTVSVSTASPLPLAVDFTTASGTATAGSDFTPISGTITFAPGETSRTIRVPILNNITAESAETFTLVLANSVGAVITDGTGVGTITDDDAIKFFVADDASANTTYRYGAPGNGLGSSVLNSGNSAPRGAASTAAGDKVWVVDANKTVYVYSAAGILLGSWTAGSLAAQAQVEGITVWGNDVWLVDAKQDKVFRYSGAATRLSGSQNAASNFDLATGNKDSKDLVTDGTSIWVVNDAANDKVFKYSLAGAALGNWTIDAANASPTGITLDPTSASQSLWIVDNGTDRVYEYAAARSRTSGSQTASVVFALAAGNTNPQGIADPPVPVSAAPLAAATLGSDISPFAETPGQPTAPPQTVAHPVRLAILGVIDASASTAGFDSPVPVTQNQNRRLLPVSTGEPRKVSDDQEKLDSIITDKPNWSPVDDFDFTPIDVTPPRSEDSFHLIDDFARSPTPKATLARHVSVPPR